MIEAALWKNKGSQFVEKKEIDPQKKYFINRNCVGIDGRTELLNDVF